jgi:D-amino-acid dehydrogenase
MQTRECDVVIIGGGVIGLACAWYLRAAGRDVVVLERAAPGAGASHGNCGTLTPSHAPPLPAPGVLRRAFGWMLRADAPLYIPPRFDPALWAWLLRFAARCNSADHAHATRVRAKLLNRSLAALDGLLQDTGIECSFSRGGLLYVFRNPDWDAHYGSLPAELAPLGIRAEAWDGARMAREEPALRPGVTGGILFPDDAQLRPDRLVAGLARAVRAAGVEILEQSEAGEFEVRGGRIQSVRAGPLRLQPREVVLAAGAWSPALGRRLGLRLPIQPGKGYSMTFAPPAPAPRRALVLKEPSVCVTAWQDGFRIGSTMEFSGYDARLNAVRLGALRRAAEEFLAGPALGEPVETWYGWRPMTSDDIPVIGRAPGLQNLVVATGHGMLGMSMAAATGELVRDILAGTATEDWLQPFSPARFT